MMKKIKLVCSICGNEDLLFDADGIWVVEKQQYRFHINEGAYCDDCDDQVLVKEVEIDEDKEEEIDDFTLS